MKIHETTRYKILRANSGAHRQLTQFLPLRFLSVSRALPPLPPATLDPEITRDLGVETGRRAVTHACELAKRVIHPPFSFPRNGFNVSQFRAVPFRVACGTTVTAARKFCFPLVDFNIVQAHRHSVAEAPPRSAIIHDSTRDAYL